jgi:prepilin-type N-terminal cleavage/methylation domain-containing protein
MKPFYSSRRHSFTLVEMLVVLAIIGILAAVLLSAASSVLRLAKRARSSVLANQLQTACLNYYSDYSVYPIPTTTSATDPLYSDTDTTDWKPLIYALCGNLNPATSTAVSYSGNSYTNSRGIAYLTLNHGDVDTSTAGSGIPLNPLPPNTTELYYYIAFDGDYSGIVGDQSPASGHVPSFTSTTITTTTGLAQPVAMWANCNPASVSGSNVNFWVHTY